MFVANRIVDQNTKSHSTVSIRKECPGDIGGGHSYRPGDNLLDLNENPALSPGRLS